MLTWLHVCTLQAGTVTDEDIDAIIEKGERDTEQLNQKLQVRPAGFSSLLNNCAPCVTDEASGWAVRRSNALTVAMT